MYQLVLKLLCSLERRSKFRSAFVIDIEQKVQSYILNTYIPYFTLKIKINTQHMTQNFKPFQQPILSTSNESKNFPMRTSLLVLQDVYRRIIYVGGLCIILNPITLFFSSFHLFSTYSKLQCCPVSILFCCCPPTPLRYLT